MKIKFDLKKISFVILIILSVLIAVIGILLYLSQRWMLKTWAHLTMEELVFQITAPLQGTSTDILWDYAYNCGFLALAALLVLIALFILIRRQKKYRWVLILSCFCLGFALSGYSVHNVYASLGVKEYIENQSTLSTFIEDNYADPATTAITFPEEKRNLIYLFLESMESTYSSKAHGGGMDVNYIPDLTDLAEQEGNINFSNTDKLGGAYTTVSTTFTSGGLFAQTSGLPLKTSVDLGDLAYQDSFFPSITCLGEILEQNGYKNYFMMGSDAAFGGRSNYFEQHGNFEMLDYYWALREGKIPDGYYQWWGYEDAKLFEYAKEKLTELGNSDEPFCFMLLTVATHFEDGYRCDQCGNEYDDHYANVIVCSSARVTELVEWIQEQSWFDNTSLVIAGDHLTMDSDFCEDIDEDYDRTVYNCFINSAAEPVNEKNRVFTTLDMFPTTLAAMGCTIEGERLGLGTNLFSETPTLAEEMGFNELNDALRPQSTFFTDREETLVKLWYGSKYYVAEDDRYAVEEWELYDPHQLWADGDQFYYLDENGKKATGWRQIGGYWYYFAESTGVLKKGPVLQPDE